MLSTKISHFLGTTSCRLTVWYGLIFAISSITVYIMAYFTLTADLGHRFDVELAEEADEFSELYRERGLSAVKTEMKEEEEDEGIQRAFFRIISPTLDVVASTNMRYWEIVNRVTPPLISRLKDKPIIRKISSRRHKYGARIICVRMFDGNVLQIGFTFTQEGRLLKRFTQIFSVVISGMIFLGCLIGWFMARRAMAGVKRVTDSAISISNGDLSSRVPIGHEGTEIENLAIAFNEMIKRIQRLINELNEVTDNIAHDLRSPITRIRLIAETTLSGNQDIKEYRRMAGVVVEECDRQVQMIRTMLDMAAMDAGVTKFKMENVNIVVLLDDAMELFFPLAQQKHIRLTLNRQGAPPLVKGNQHLLQRVISNLLDNAIKYTPENGTVRLEVSASPEYGQVSVINSGSGISEEDLPNIFKPFYRADKSRSTQGNGLGLSLARSIILAHSGNIWVKSSPNKETEVAFQVPLAG